MEEKEKKQGFLKNQTPALIGLVGVIVGILLTQIFMNRTETIRRNQDVAGEVIKVQYLYASKLHRIGELGRGVSVVSFRRVYIFEGETDSFAEDNEGVKYTLPEITQDSTVQNEWNLLVNEILDDREAIDPELIASLNDIVNFAKEHPFPDENDSLEEIVRSRWTDKDVIGRWFSLNDNLMLKTEKYLPDLR
jgi:hypothetical protein